MAVSTTSCPTVSCISVCSSPGCRHWHNYPTSLSPQHVPSFTDVSPLVLPLLLQQVPRSPVSTPTSKGALLRGCWSLSNPWNVTPAALPHEHHWDCPRTPGKCQAWWHDSGHNVQRHLGDLLLNTFGEGKRFEKGTDPAGRQLVMPLVLVMGFYDLETLPKEEMGFTWWSGTKLSLLAGWATWKENFKLKEWMKGDNGQQSCKEVRDQLARKGACMVRSEGTW